MPTLYNLPIITIPGILNDRYSVCAGCGKYCKRTEAYCYDCRDKAARRKPCPNAGCENLCSRTSLQCRSCRSNSLRGKPQPECLRQPAKRLPARRNAVGQRVLPPKPAPSVSITAPVCTPAPVPSPKRNTKGLTPRQVAIVDVILNRAHDLCTFAKIGEHFGSDRETMRREIRQIARDMDCSVGTIRDRAHLRGFSTWQGRRVTAKDLEVAE